MKILITSGGQLATLLFNALKDDHEVRVMRRRPDDAFGNACRVGDVSIYDDVLRAMDGCEIVFHTAVRNDHDMEPPNYRDFVSTNVDGTFNVFLAAMHLGVKRVVHSSTSMVNGFHEAAAQLTPGQGAARRFDDQAPCQQTDVYGLTKIMGELAADHFRDRFGLSIISLRYGWLAPLELYRDPAMLYNTLHFCFHEQDALAANLLVMNQNTVGNYLVSAPSLFTDRDAEDLWQKPQAALERYYPDELAYLQNIGFTPTPIAAWLDCSRAIDELGYQPQYDFKRFIKLHREGAFGV
jgi:nucleoside-diphosphate-sugar epimerase